MRMKQKVSISSLPIHWGILILLIFIPQLLSAQENNDSIRIARDSVSMEPESVLQRSTLEIFPEKSTTYSLYPARQSEHMPRFSLKRDISLPYQTNPSLLFRGLPHRRDIASIRPRGSVRLREPDKHGRYRAFQ